jgi:predicted RNase H-like HicB family nuclease
MKTLTVHADWDDEAAVWVAESEDVPGLATYAETIDQLLAKLKVMVPELLEANGHLFDETVPDRVPFELITRASAERHPAA